MLYALRFFDWNMHMDLDERTKQHLRMKRQELRSGEPIRMPGPMGTETFQPARPHPHFELDDATLLAIYPLPR
ncbi:hypothetical protein WS96_16390 [Burkholderia sp. MSMB1835]|nr:hypothetical protein WS96_16390 [Burkholderia sp. MSMB1835]